MKIITIVRTLNEERNIEKFLNGYSFSDEIIISDGGSTDETYKIASRIAKKFYPRMTITWNDFDKDARVPNLTGGYFTHEPKQINWLIDEAKKHGADWIIYDDCDCWPNFELLIRARMVFDMAEKEGYKRLLIKRLYVYKGNWYFPEMNKPGASLWAWKPNDCAVYCKEEDPKESGMVQDTSVNTYTIDPPYVLLHNFAQSEKHIKQKMAWYKAKGQPQLHPKEGCGILKLLPNYAHI